ncbi:MAG: hypothetical protein QG657_4932 [Acidobacteriota bacterium]|nr:hypothetical protein [Acidobacteriota bacterium]
MTSENLSLTVKNQDAVDVVDWSTLNEEEQKQARQIAGQINFKDSQAVVAYGVGAQRDIAAFSDTILSEVRAKDTGFVGEILTDLLLKVKGVDVDSLGADGGFLSKIPLVGGLFNRFQRFIAGYQKISTQIDHISDELDKARMGLLRDITLMDQMFDKNIGYLKNLDIYITAGQFRLKEIQEKELPGIKQEAEASQDPILAQQFQDLQQFLNRFDKKLHDLKLSRMVAIQTSPQLRLVQNGNQELVEKIQSSILNTIPLWKNQIVIAITLFRQKKALQLQQEVSDTTNELLQKNSELLKQSSIEIAKETERGIVDIETLKKVNTDLVATIEETLKIQQEGRQKRRLAEVELRKLETDLKEKLVSLTS